MERGHHLVKERRGREKAKIDKREKQKNGTEERMPEKVNKIETRYLAEYE